MFNVLYHAIVLTLRNSFWSHQGFKIVYFKILYYYLKCVCESHSVMFDSLWPHGLFSLWNSPGQNTGVGSLSLPQGIFPIQGSNPGLPHCRQILYELSHKGSILGHTLDHLYCPKWCLDFITPLPLFLTTNHELIVLSDVRKSRLICVILIKIWKVLN